jgi:hypothetical protein
MGHADAAGAVHLSVPETGAPSVAVDDRIPGRVRECAAARRGRPCSSEGEAAGSVVLGAVGMCEPHISKNSNGLAAYQARLPQP